MRQKSFVIIGMLIILYFANAQPVLAWANSSYPYVVFINVSNDFRPTILESNWSDATGTNNGTHVYFGGQSGLAFSGVAVVLNNVTLLPRCWNSVTNHTDINVTGNGTIGIYYGANIASNVNQCEGTYPVYDTFSGTSVNTTNWSVAGSPTVSGGIATLAGDTVQIGSLNNIISTTSYPAIMIASVSRSDIAFMGFWNTNPPNVQRDAASGIPGAYNSSSIQPLYMCTFTNVQTCNYGGSFTGFPTDSTNYRLYWWTNSKFGDIENGTLIKEQSVTVPSLNYLHPLFAAYSSLSIVNIDYVYSYTQLIDSASWGSQSLSPSLCIICDPSFEDSTLANWIELKQDPNGALSSSSSTDRFTDGSRSLFLHAVGSAVTPPNVGDFIERNQTVNLLGLNELNFDLFSNSSGVCGLITCKMNFSVSLNGTIVFNYTSDNSAIWKNESINTTAYGNGTLLSLRATTVGAFNLAGDNSFYIDNLSEVLDTTPPKSITNLQNTVSNLNINWTWNNPIDADFDHIMIYINGAFIQNQSSSFYNFVAPSNSVSTISTHTVDIIGNLNSTWVNQSVTVGFALVPPTEPSGAYSFLNNTIPSNATIQSYSNNSLMTTVVTLDWDNITASNWSLLLQGINYSYTNGIRTALRLNLGGDYTKTSIQNSTKNNITVYFPNTTSDPYQSDIQWIELNFTNTTSPSADERNYANITARNISEQSANHFPVYTVTSLSGLDNNYVKSSPLIYMNIINNSDFISQESVTTRGNTTLSRVYSGNETTLPLISSYKTNVFNKLRGAIATSHPAESYATNVNNGSGGYDIILYNNQSTTQNRTVANAIGTFLDVNNDIMEKFVTSGTLHFNVSGESAIYILNESVSKILLNDTGHVVYGQMNNFNNSFVYGANQFTSYIYAGSTEDIKIELYDPTYTKNNTYMNHYEWINSSLVSNYTDYKYVIISDKNPSGINTTINRTNATDPMSIPFFYFSVGDYTDNGGAWVSAKKSETDWALSRGLNVFLDGIDSAVQTGGNFSADVKSVITYVRVNNSRKVICNSYTAYTQFATVCDAMMKESAFSRWDGTVSAPVYSWEDMTLEKQRADYYTTHNIPVLLQSYGDVSDYNKQYFDFLAGAVLYGYNGNNSFRYGQPNFQSQRDIYVPNIGDMLERGYTQTSSTDWNRLYSKGRVHINPVNHTASIDNNKVVNNMSVDLYLYSGGTGSGDRNVTLVLNTPNGTYYNATYDGVVGVWRYVNIPIPISEYKEHGQYRVYFATRPIAGGNNFIGEDNTAKTGIHSWYDTTSANINSEGNDSNYTWTALPRDTQWIVRLNVDYNTTLQIDTLNVTAINQTDSRANYNRTVTINSTNEYNATIYSKPITLITSSISSVKFLSNGSWVTANLPTTNITDINVTNIASWTNTVINGETFGMVQRFVDSTHWQVRFFLPHLSTQQAMILENVAPIISNVTNQTVDEGATVYVAINGSDANGDPLTFSTNRSDLFTDFNTTTGQGNWTANYSSAGTYYVDFGVSDGLATANQTMMITVNNIPLSVSSFSPSGDVSVSKGTSQAFSIILNRTANITWLLNSVSAQTNTGVTTANYINNGTTTGTFNITASATDGVDTVSRTWNLTVTPASTSSTSGGGYVPDYGSIATTKPTSTPLPTITPPTITPIVPIVTPLPTPIQPITTCRWFDDLNPYNKACFLSFLKSKTLPIVVSPVVTALPTQTVSMTEVPGIPQNLTEADMGAKTNRITVILNGSSARISTTGFHNPPFQFLNLFFSTSYSGEYTIEVTTYQAYNPGLEGAIRYFSISPMMDLVAGSSLDINSDTPIFVYQLLSDGNWKELQGTQEISSSVYRIPITSFGVFAVTSTEVQGQVTQTPTTTVMPSMQPKAGIFNINFSSHLNELVTFISALPVYANIAQKDKTTYEVLQAKQVQFIESLSGLHVNWGAPQQSTASTAPFNFLPMVFFIFVSAIIIYIFTEIGIIETSFFGVIFMLIYTQKYQTFTIIQLSPILTLLSSALVFALAGAVVVRIIMFFGNPKNSYKPQKKGKGKISQ